MQCRNCQYDLPAGVAFCPNCGTPIPASGGTPFPPTMLGSAPNQEIAPTIAASGPGQAFPPPPPGNQYAPPPTNYGENAPPPPSSFAANPYTAPQPAPYDPNYAQPAPYPMAGTYPPQQFVPPPQKKKANGCVIALIIVLVVVVLGVGGVIAAGAFVLNKANNAVATTTSDFKTAVPTISSELTPTAGTGSAPSSSQIDATAATMITSHQTTSGIDSDYLPVDSQSTFDTGDKVYVTFKTAGHDGYIISKWYLDGDEVLESSVVQDDDGNTNGYFSGTFEDSGSAVIGLYWCTKSDCSDAALAQVASVTIS